jgi:TPR repeat protein
MTFLGNKSNQKKAIEYYKKAALKNYAPAYVALGDMYATGKGIAHDALKQKNII